MALYLWNEKGELCIQFEYFDGKLLFGVIMSAQNTMQLQNRYLKWEIQTEPAFLIADREDRSRPGISQHQVQQDIDPHCRNQSLKHFTVFAGDNTVHQLTLPADALKAVLGGHYYIMLHAY